VNKLFVMLVVSVLVGCGTVGGAMQGAAQDLNQVGTYVKRVGN
jgi:hypothetical protein